MLLDAIETSIEYTLTSLVISPMIPFTFPTLGLHHTPVR
jgi:hypothetical protein